MTTQGLQRERRVTLGPVDVTVGMPPELADKVKANPVYRGLVKPTMHRLSRLGHRHNGNGHAQAHDLLPPVPITPPQPADLDRQGRTIIEKISGQEWYHSIDLGHGVITPGFVDHRDQLPYYALPASLRGKRVLDVATFDGYWAFEFERRGAEVVAADIARWTDVDVPSLMLPHAACFGLDRPTGRGFRLAHEILDSQVQRVECSVYDLDPERIGTFDLVFISDLLVHLRDPQLALERAYSVCHGEVLVADVYTPKLEGMGDVALAVFTAPSETWWLPNIFALRAMMRTAGFESIDEISRFALEARTDDTIHKVVLRGAVTTQPEWVRQALEYKRAARDSSASRNGS
jgi:tRNA (mo5U34)-methyltransferase